jgi:hypothetical protein
MLTRTSHTIENIGSTDNRYSFDRRFSRKILRLDRACGFGVRIALPDSVDEICVANHALIVFQPDNEPESGVDVSQDFSSQFQVCKVIAPGEGRG